MYLTKSRQNKRERKGLMDMLKGIDEEGWEHTGVSFKFCKVLLTEHPIAKFTKPWETFFLSNVLLILSRRLRNFGIVRNIYCPNQQIIVVVMGQKGHAVASYLSLNDITRSTTITQREHYETYAYKFWHIEGQWDKDWNITTSIFLCRRHTIKNHHYFIIIIWILNSFAMWEKH